MANHVQKYVLNNSQVRLNVVVDDDRYVAITVRGSAIGNGHGPVRIGAHIDVDNHRILDRFVVGQDGDIAIEDGAQTLLKKGAHMILVEFPNQNANATGADADVTIL